MHQPPWEFKNEWILSKYSHTTQRRVKRRTDQDDAPYLNEIDQLVRSGHKIAAPEVDKPNVTETKEQSRRAEDLFKVQSRVLNKTDPPGRDVPPKKVLEPKVYVEEKGTYDARKPVEVPDLVQPEEPEYVSKDIKLTPKTKPEEIAEVRENWNKKYPLLAQSFVTASEYPTQWREPQVQLKLSEAAKRPGRAVVHHARAPWEPDSALLVCLSAASLAFSQTVKTMPHRSNYSGMSSGLRRIL